jgi:hypothetical protein
MCEIRLNHNSEHNYIIVDFTKIFLVNNVIKYSIDNFNTWVIEHSFSELESNSIQYYFIIDTTISEAFSHWVFESAIYLPLFKELKEIYPNLKLVLKEKRDFKTLFCNYFNITNDDIVYEILSNNISLFPAPISCWNERSISSEYITLILKFRDFFLLKNEIDIKNENIILPRQKKENFKGNDRSYDFSKLINKMQNNSFILNTDAVEDLKYQIQAVQTSKNIFITEGSPFFVNGFFCTNKNIFIIDAYATLDQEHSYPKLKFVYDLIRNNNKVIVIKQDDLINTILN